MPRLCTLLLTLSMTATTTMAASFPTVSTMLPELDGKLAVASSNLTLKADIAPKDMKPYLDGSRSLLGNQTYIDDALATKKGALSFTLAVPDNEHTFGESAGQNVDITGMVFYPTTHSNPQKAYSVQANVFEDREVILQHMQTSDDTQASGKTYPLVLFSHGWGAHPLYDFDFLQALASQGMVVVALFHGDRRFESFAEMQSLRAYGLIEAVRQLKASPWQQLPDYTRTAVIGVSFGGSVALSLAGAQLNGYQGLALPKDLARLQTVIGMVPATTYRGEAKWNFDKLALAPLMIMAEKDTSVELAPALALMDAHKNYTPDVVVMRDEEHFVSAEKWQIARQLVLLKLRTTLLDDEKSGKVLDKILKQGEFSEINVVRRAE